MRRSPTNRCLWTERQIGLAPAAGRPCTRSDDRGRPALALWADGLRCKRPGLIYGQCFRTDGIVRGGAKTARASRGGQHQVPPSLHKYNYLASTGRPRRELGVPKGCVPQPRPPLHLPGCTMTGPRLGRGPYIGLPCDRASPHAHLPLDMNDFQRSPERVAKILPLAPFQCPSAAPQGLNWG